MYYKCKVCEHEEARGCLPTVTCGVYLLFLIGCMAGIAAVTARMIRGDAPPQALNLGGWRLLVVPLSLVGALVGAMILNAILELMEYLVFAFRRCPNCGARRWSWGYTRGFGL